MNKVIHQKQPFGEVINSPMHSGSGQSATTKNQMSATTEIPNHGKTVVETFADKGAGAEREACRNNDNSPFAWTGHPKK